MKAIIRTVFLLLAFSLVFGGMRDGNAAPIGTGEAQTLKLGDRLPDASLTGLEGTEVRLTEGQGRVRLISIVPQLNTPVCDEQTHHFSEQNGGIDRMVEIVTISTNTSGDQDRFARKADITNMTFLSDAPKYDFGAKSGLLLPFYKILHRSVIVADAENTIRYLQLVPMGELPNFDAALDSARRLVRQP